MRHLLFFVLLIGLISCKKKEKENQQDVQGTISNRYSGQVVEGATVILKARLVENGVYHGNFSTLASAQTDASGNYQMSFDRVNAGVYLLEVRRSGYFSIADTIKADDVNYSNPYSHNASIPSQSSVSVKIKNTPDADSTDKITYNYTGTAMPCDCCVRDLMTFVGLVDTTLNCNVYGDRMFTYNYVTQTKTNPYQLRKDSVFVPAGQNVQVNINF